MHLKERLKDVANTRENLNNANIGIRNSAASALTFAGVSAAGLLSAIVQPAILAAVLIGTNVTGYSAISNIYAEHNEFENDMENFEKTEDACISNMSMGINNNTAFFELKRPELSSTNRLELTCCVAGVVKQVEQTKERGHRIANDKQQEIAQPQNAHEMRNGPR